MDLFFVNVSSRVLHILGAIVLFGGAVFIRYLLMPAASTLPEDQHEQLRERIFKRWRKWLGILIGILIFTGFYNFLWVQIPLHKGDKIYHMLMGIKILLAFWVFFMASALAGRAKAFAGIRHNAKFWLTLNILCATAIVAIAGFLKVRGPFLNP
ncbi:hypothetical protein [Planctomicrobium piriforme]|uniref:Copper resistance protein D n=1 Tax=Planctomicrobium piriforme TaxID=1576369 RepID=A0A1I3KQQ4_9PLAN|nr:hypothetical protein [Planctomicrobium piriforme]SFI74829.1 hypothetical protein SAMN05421753_11214 [Planctomicrobium piriforme]